MAKIRSKRSRLRGKRTCGYGSRKKHRGKGSRGGYGMAGTGKMAGHKRIYLMRFVPDYMGKHGFVSRNEKLEEINLGDISKKIDYFIKKGIAKKTHLGIEFNFKGFKVLSKGNIDKDFIIRADKFSEKAKIKIQEAGSKAIEPEAKKKPVQEKKT